MVLSEKTLYSLGRRCVYIFNRWKAKKEIPAIIPFAMPSWNEVENAQQRMNAAHEALRAYLKRPSSQPQDIKLYGRLADELRLTVNEYMDLIIEFLMQRPSS